MRDFHASFGDVFFALWDGYLERLCPGSKTAALHLLFKAPGNPVGGFIHVPLAPVQAAQRTGGAPSMASETAADGLAAIIRALTR